LWISTGSWSIHFFLFTGKKLPHPPWTSLTHRKITFFLGEKEWHLREIGLLQRSREREGNRPVKIHPKPYIEVL
jgi:hypothetical protein